MPEPERHPDRRHDRRRRVLRGRSVSSRASCGRGSSRCSSRFSGSWGRYVWRGRDRRGHASAMPASRRGSPSRSGARAASNATWRAWREAFFDLIAGKPHLPNIVAARPAAVDVPVQSADAAAQSTDVATESAGSLAERAATGDDEPGPTPGTEPGPEARGGAGADVIGALSRECQRVYCNDIQGG